MIAPDGGINVLEFNARFGDPETQSYLRLLDSDLLDLLNACVDGTLSDTSINWSRQTAITVVLAAKGYPGEYFTGDSVTGVKDHSIKRLRSWRLAPAH